MSYMDRIDSVAQVVSSKTRHLGDQILHHWAEVEELAGPWHYDLFDPAAKKLRESMLRLLSLLYQVPGSSHEADCAQLREKNALYGGSWCRRGGSGAFHMLARKADRFAEQWARTQKLDGDVEDTLGDLRRYLILVEAWLEEQESPRAMTPKTLGETLIREAKRSGPPKSVQCIAGMLGNICDQCGLSMPDGCTEHACEGVPF